MPSVSFQFRVCQNPECGLRYPARAGLNVGVRCPRCMGKTIVVAEHVSSLEPDESPRLSKSSNSLGCVLDNVRSALNVGSIFRTAEGYGFAHLYLCGVTPAPDIPQVQKTALGAEQMLPWSSHLNGVELVASLKRSGYCLWALERTAASRAIKSAAAQGKLPQDCVLIVGNEQAGVDPGILELADEILHLEMRGKKQSFNVSIAFAIAAQILSEGDG